MIKKTYLRLHKYRLVFAAGATIFIIVSIYLFKFWSVGACEPSVGNMKCSTVRLMDSPDRLGQLGDFVGGLVNPAFGLLTIFLLLKTLKHTESESEFSNAYRHREEFDRYVSRKFQAVGNFLFERRLYQICFPASDKSLLLSKKLDQYVRNRIIAFYELLESYQTNSERGLIDFIQKFNEQYDSLFYIFEGSFAVENERYEGVPSGPCQIDLEPRFDLTDCNLKTHIYHYSWKLIKLYDLCSFCPHFDKKGHYFNLISKLYTVHQSMPELIFNNGWPQPWVGEDFRKKLEEISPLVVQVKSIDRRL